MTELGSACDHRHRQDALGLPATVEFTRGFVQSLRISIPWRHLTSRPIDVVLDGVQVVARVRDVEQDIRAADTADSPPETGAGATPR